VPHPTRGHGVVRGGRIAAGRLIFATLITATSSGPAAAQAHQAHAAADSGGARILNSARMMVPMIRNPMIPGLAQVRPTMAPFLPGAETDLSTLPSGVPRQIVDLADGDTLDLEAMLVRRTVAGRAFAMYGFNRQSPGPLVRVARGTTIHVRFHNAIDQPTTVHWHGVRLDNRFDGVPGVTQDPVEPGGDFLYTVHFPDAGIFWYHPHIREDVQQDLGLYGNMLVRSERADYDNPANLEEVVTMDDILLDGNELLPFGKGAANFAIMGRFGNVPLINGEDLYRRTVRRGWVVRYYLTNVSNTRTFNLSFDGAPMKLVGADIGRFEREMMVRSVAIAPAQRYVVEVLFERPGQYALTNRIQGVDHMQGDFLFAVDTLGLVTVEDEPTEADHGESFRTLREDEELVREIDRFRAWFDRPPDRELLLTVQIRDLPIQLMQFIAVDTVYRAPVEWTDPMPHMNWLSTTNEVRWILRDRDSREENMDIGWRFAVGDVVKIRLRNDPEAFHPMNHPVHLHGQRFLVLARDGVPNQNLAWKDTALVPVGSVVDILPEVTNPGNWMLHCHIAEPLEAGRIMSFTVEAP